ncbi:MAG: hypothetical protein OCD00_01960 [Colwellia sp.]
MPEYKVSQMHIEAARNATDDLNLFHDKNRWHKIKRTPFQGSITLGFQLGCFVEDQVNRFFKSDTNQLNNAEKSTDKNSALVVYQHKKYSSMQKYN